jgi:xanthine/uracil permease
MNIMLWVIQVLLAVWNLLGGSYTISNFDKLKSHAVDGLPASVWVALGVLQIIAAIALVIPGKLVKAPMLASIAAGYIAVYALSGCFLFAQYAGFPGLLWAVVPAALAAVVAFGRMR